ncbi:MAG TPA: ABC transporter permease [Candidatus Pacearchaeota archaeon]|nr:ABC transporter permease [Candidatus Pacearchaeota archaeon]
MKEYFVLASKNLKKRGIRSALTLLGIFVGIAAVVSLISLGNTLKATINSQFDNISPDIISVQAGGISGVGAPGTGVSNPLTESDAEAIERIGSVEFAVPRSIETIMAEFNDKVSFLSVGSLPDSYRIDDIYRQQSIEAASGRLLRANERGRIIIGANLASGKNNGFEKDLKVGDELLVKGQEFLVTGIIEKKGSFIVDNAVYMNERQLKDLNNLGEEVDVITVKAKSVELVEITKQEIEKLLRERRDVKIGEEDFEVSTSESILASVNQILMGVQIFIIIIASMSIVVGAIGIANTMTTSVLERRKEIGTMKAVGARNEDIFYQFFVEAGLLGFVGGLIGVLLGEGISYLGTFVLNQAIGISTKTNISWVLILGSLAGSFLIGAVSGIIPAMKAAKENPVEAIRG